MRAKAWIAAALLAMVAGCSDAGSPSAIQPTPTQKWTDTLNSVINSAGHTVALHLAQPESHSTPTTRCWRVEESADGQAVGSVSACHQGDQIAASRILGAIIVVTDCPTSPNAAVRNEVSKDNVHELYNGIFLLPETTLTAGATTVQLTCAASPGTESSAVEIPISG